MAEAKLSQSVIISIVWAETAARVPDWESMILVFKAAKAVLVRHPFTSISIQNIWEGWLAREVMRQMGEREAVAPAPARAAAQQVSIATTADLKMALCLVVGAAGAGVVRREAVIRVDLARPRGEGMGDASFGGKLDASNSAY